MNKRRSPRITPKMAAKAKFLVLKRGLLQHQAAAVLGVNQGRVSEVMTGKRFAEVDESPQLSLDIA